MTTIISIALLSFFSHFIVLTTAQQDFIYHLCYNDVGNYTSTSSYDTNLKTLLSNLTSDPKVDYGYYTSSEGQNPNRVNALGLCRADVKPDSCRTCLNNATILLRKLCPNQKEAYGYNDGCILRYANRSMFGINQDSDFSIFMCNPSNATDNYNEVLDGLMRRLRGKATAGDSRRKFAAGTVAALFQTVYGFAQCMPDLAEQDCDDCLEKAISSIPRLCNNRIGGRIIKLSCNVRYENYRFYDDVVLDSLSSSPPAASPSNTSSSQGNGHSTSRTVIIVAVSIGAFVAILILICIYFVVRRSKKPIETDQPEAEHDEIKPIESLQFNFNTIKLATDNFSIANKLGQGGFGSVYKGKLPNGQDIAVKRLSMDSGQGDSEFKNEVLLVAKLQHRNLVRLLGFSLEKKERLLAYEFLPNRSLDYLLFDSNQRVHLNWIIRYKIIGGIARGLLYLHEDSRLRIIHRDLKASNILLDEELNPKISDFGMARLFVVDQTQSNTSRIVGTYGYMAPEYAMHGQFSIKSDVFSFGILVLEIVSGKKNNSVFDEENAHDLLSYAWKNWREGMAFNLADPMLKNCSRNEIMRCIHIGLLCVQENVADRPTMASVVVMLNSYSSSLPFPSKPPLLINTRGSSEIHLREYSSEATRSSEGGSNSMQQSVNEASITEPYPR
ncbi:putative receptor-like protein kinase At4g00960 isoform X3 [Neltuma alba]|uniref:putative receptor-like protein kinase At4g00960 isoform X3 n=1 Tax=Neltuma alba TaxID=207710 RepID=UPI0010A5748E|nr:putative receptor-like protein kinase At4g00960 isoform X3 [Prosopis alba]